MIWTMRAVAEEKTLERGVVLPGSRRRIHKQAHAALVHRVMEGTWTSEEDALIRWDVARVEECIILLNTYELRFREPVTTLGSGSGSGESGEEAPALNARAVGFVFSSDIDCI